MECRAQIKLYFAPLIRNLPEGLSPEREAVVRTACSLVGKVNYFWGGKSLVIGWDANGELLIIHCASGYNNVVITGKKGFTSIGRPQYYAEAGHS